MQNAYWEFAVHDEIKSSEKSWKKNSKTGHYSITKQVKWDGVANVDHKPVTLARDNFPAEAKMALYPPNDATTKYTSAKGQIDLVPSDVLEEWKLYHTGLIEGRIAGGLDGYMKFRGLYKGKNRYFIENPTVSPLKHFKDNLVKIDFMGTTITVHKMLESFFKELETECGCSYPPPHTYFMREINGASGMSPHAFGLAVDFWPKKNPQIRNLSAQSRHVILKSTEFDICKSKAGYSNQEIRDKHDLFQSLYSSKGIGIENLISKYKQIDDHDRLESALKLEEGLLAKLNTEVELFKAKIGDFILAQELHGKISTAEFDGIIGDVETFIQKLDDTKLIAQAYKHTVVFENVDKLSGLTAELEKQIAGFEDLKLGLDVEGNFDYYIINIEDYRRLQSYLSLTEGDYSTLWREIEGFYKVIFYNTSNKKYYYKKYETLEEFGNALKVDMANIGFKNVLLVDGFCDIDMRIIDAFFKLAKEYGLEQYAQWGGKFSSKIDAMHIGFNQKKYKEILQILEQRINSTENEEEQ